MSYWHDGPARHRRNAVLPIDRDDYLHLLALLDDAHGKIGAIKRAVIDLRTVFQRSLELLDDFKKAIDFMEESIAQAQDKFKPRAPSIG